MPLQPRVYMIEECGENVVFKWSASRSTSIQIILHLILKFFKHLTFAVYSVHAIFSNFDLFRPSSSTVAKPKYEWGCNQCPDRCQITNAEFRLYVPSFNASPTWYIYTNGLVAESLAWDSVINSSRLRFFVDILSISSSLAI